MTNIEQIEQELKNKFNASNVWIPIYQNNFDDGSSRQSWFMTFSTDKIRSISTANWDDYFGTYYCKNKGDIGEIKYYLVILRQGNAHLNDCIEIAEDFRLFYNLYKENEDYYFDDDEDPQKVIRYDKDKKLYEIKYSYLMEYISYKKIYAVLNFELDLYHCDSKEPYCQIKTDDLVAIKESWTENKGDFTTRFMGKCILNYSEIISKGQNVVKFIIGKDDNDNYKYATIKDGHADVIVDVCFDRKVLRKYYDRPEIYRVAYSTVSCDNKWCLDGLNTETFKEITISTHNLAKLPYKEQVYWHDFSKIGEDLEIITRDVQSTSRLTSAIENLKYYWKIKYKNVLIKDIAIENRYIVNKIYVPISTELSEFFDIIKNICTYCIETIDTKCLRDNTRAKFITTGTDGKIIYSTRCALRDFFKSNDLEFDKEDEFLKNLISIRDHSSHIKSSDFKKAQQYFHLDKIGTQQCVVNIANELYLMYKKLADCFNLHI